MWGLIIILSVNLKSHGRHDMTGINMVVTLLPLTSFTSWYDWNNRIVTLPLQVDMTGINIFDPPPWLHKLIWLALTYLSPLPFPLTGSTNWLDCHYIIVLINHSHLLFVFWLDGQVHFADSLHHIGQVSMITPLWLSVLKQHTLFSWAQHKHTWINTTQYNILIFFQFKRNHLNNVRFKYKFYTLPVYPLTWKVGETRRNKVVKGIRELFCFSKMSVKVKELVLKVLINMKL